MAHPARVHRRSSSCRPRRKWRAPAPAALSPQTGSWARSPLARIPFPQVSTRHSCQPRQFQPRHRPNIAASIQDSCAWRSPHGRRALRPGQTSRRRPTPHRDVHPHKSNAHPGRPDSRVRGIGASTARLPAHWAGRSCRRGAGCPELRPRRSRIRRRGLSVLPVLSGVRCSACFLRIVLSDHTRCRYVTKTGRWGKPCPFYLNFPQLRARL